MTYKLTLWNRRHFFMETVLCKILSPWQSTKWTLYVLQGIVPVGHFTHRSSPQEYVIGTFSCDAKMSLLLTEVILKYIRLSCIWISSTQSLTFEQTIEQEIWSQTPPRKFHIRIYFSSLNYKDGEKKI